jgi:hypothetical protein
VPAYEWLQNGLSGWAKDMLLGSTSHTATAFRRDVVTSLIDRSAGGDIAAAHKVWNLLILEQWLQSWNADLT